MIAVGTAVVFGGGLHYCSLWYRIKQMGERLESTKKLLNERLESTEKLMNEKLKSEKDGRKAAIEAALAMSQTTAIRDH